MHLSEGVMIVAFRWCARQFRVSSRAFGHVVLVSVISIDFLRQFRLRHGLSQTRMAAVISVPGSRYSSWEKGEGQPGKAEHDRMLELLSDLPSELMAGLRERVVKCDLARALSKTRELNLQCLSGPAVEKRPSITEWLGHDMAPIATDVLRVMLDDGHLQRSISAREIAGVVATTKSVLKTSESDRIGIYRTTITYFFHDGVLYSDAIGLPVEAEERLGYTPILYDEFGSDLFGDQLRLQEALALTKRGARPAGN